MSWNRRWVTLTNAELAYAYEKVAPWRGTLGPCVRLPGLASRRSTACHRIPPAHPTLNGAPCGARRSVGWQSKKIIDRIHVSDILDVVTENDAASGDGLEFQRPAYLGASLTAANRVARRQACASALWGTC